MQLDDEIVAVRPGTSILIRPGTRHRAIGEMTVLIVVWPKFDPEDEWLEDQRPEGDRIDE
jgi:mannose-6-phosphate isomerase-like protein (cupin superfamily)